ncbi:MAG: Hypothetical protein AJITA_00917 [Acetilactobacillus jinshanensis]
MYKLNLIVKISEAFTMYHQVSGKIIHFYLIDDQGHLERNDALRKFAHKNRHQEYLDYFYCIAKNTESCVNSKDP